MLICQDQRSGAGCGARQPNDVLHCSACGMSLAYGLRLHDHGVLIASVYHVIDLIGHGGFGAVYLAEDRRQTPPLRVALKESFDPQNIRSFRGEFQVLYGLSHPHLPAYYEMFEHDGSGYLVMEYAPGQSLEELHHKQQGPLLETLVLGYALQLCDALHYLHQQLPPILHRDIKPANIRLTPDGVIKLVDFGLVKQGLQATRSSRLGLTLMYAPLEQYSGRSSTDERSDIYSLGATLYHLFTGEEPLSVTDRIAQFVDPLQPPHSLRNDLTPHLSDAVMRAMALRREDRFPDALTFKRALLGSGPLNAGMTTIASPSVGTATQRVCPDCGTPNVATEVYCQKCAFQLRADQKCPHCGKPTPAGASFCARCGRSL